VSFIFALKGVTGAQFTSSIITKTVENFAALVRVETTQISFVVLSSRRLQVTSSTTGARVQFNVFGVTTVQVSAIVQRVQASLSTILSIFNNAGLAVSSATVYVTQSLKPSPMPSKTPSFKPSNHVSVSNQVTVRPTVQTANTTVSNQVTVRPTVQTANTTGSTTAATMAPISSFVTENNFAPTNSKAETDKRPIISGTSYSGGIAVVVVIPIFFSLLVAGNVYLHRRRRRVDFSKVSYEREQATKSPNLRWPSDVDEEKVEIASPEPVAKNSRAKRVSPHPNSSQGHNVTKSGRPSNPKRVSPHPHVTPKKSEDFLTKI